MPRVGDLILGARVVWTPCKVEGWVHADTVCNEFTTYSLLSHTDELSTLQWEAYMQWSELRVEGKIFAHDADQVVIELDCPVDLTPLEYDDTYQGDIFEYVAYQEEQEGDWAYL